MQSVPFINSDLKKKLFKVFGLLKTDFIKVSSWSAFSTIVKMTTGFISIKVVSSVIGPTGIAMVGQFLNSITMISSLATGGIGYGVTKFIAEYHKEPQKQVKVIAHSMKITLAFTTLFSLLVILFSSQLGKYVFKSDNYQNLIILFGFSLVLYSVNTLLISILNGFKAFKRFVTVNILSSLLGLGIAIVLVLEYGLYGALLNCIVSQSIIILVSLFLLYKEPWFTSLFAKFPTDWQLIKQLGGFTLMSLTSAIVVPFSQLSVRSTISSILSLHDAGIWEGMNRLSAMYLTLITSSIGIYYLPRLAELTKRNEIRTEIYKTFALVMPVLCLASLSIFLLRDFIVRTVYTSEFDSMRELFGWQMLGDIFKIGSWLIAYLFWAKGLVKLFLITEVAFSLMYIVLTKAAVTYFGLQGSVIAYAVNYIIYFIVMIILFKSILVNQDETGIIAG